MTDRLEHHWAMDRNATRPEATGGVDPGAVPPRTWLATGARYAPGIR